MHWVRGTQNYLKPQKQNININIKNCNMVVSNNSNSKHPNKPQQNT